MNLARSGKYTAVVWYEFVLSMVFALPRFRLANAVKSLVLRVLGAKIGRGVVYYPGVRILPAQKLSIGDDVDFAWGVIVTAGGGVSIGSRTLVGYNSMILSANHVVPPLPESIFHAGHDRKPVSIGEDVWIGAGCVVLPGVSIGDHAIVAAGSVVTKSVARGAVVAGVPARVIRHRAEANVV